MISPELIKQFYIEACDQELQAFKPGNVSVFADGHDMRVEDFTISARVSATAIADPCLSLGEKIYHAVAETRKAVGCNTNLGIVLLCVPLAAAAHATGERQSLREQLEFVLNNSSVQDAEWVFKAISLAAPGGLGKSNEQDVAEEARVTLLQAMQLASQRDRIALQFSTVFKDVFEFGVLRYNSRLYRWGKMDWATLAVYTGLLSQFADSHIERKYGTRFNEYVAQEMQYLDMALANSDEPELLEAHCRDLDQKFKQQGINPGTTADLTVASLFTAKLMDYFAS